MRTVRGSAWLIASLFFAGVAVAGDPAEARRYWFDRAREAALEQPTLQERERAFASLVQRPMLDTEWERLEAFGREWVEIARQVDLKTLDNAHRAVVNRLLALNQPERALAWADRYGLDRPPPIQLEVALNHIEAGDVAYGVNLVRQVPDAVTPMQPRDPRAAAAIHLCRHGWLHEAVALYHELPPEARGHLLSEMLVAAAERHEEAQLRALLQPLGALDGPVITDAALARAYAKVGRIDEAVALFHAIEPRFQRRLAEEIAKFAVVHDRLGVTIQMLQRLPREYNRDLDRLRKVESSILSMLAGSGDAEGFARLVPHVEAPIQTLLLDAAREGVRRGQVESARALLRQHFHFHDAHPPHHVRALTLLGEHHSALALAVEQRAVYYLFDERCELELWGLAVEALPHLDNVFLRVHRGGRLIDAAYEAGRDDWLHAIRMDLRERLVSGDGVTNHYRLDLQRLEATAGFHDGGEPTLRAMMDSDNASDASLAASDWASLTGDEGVRRAWPELTPKQRRLVASSMVNRTWTRVRDEGSVNP